MSRFLNRHYRTVSADEFSHTHFDIDAADKSGVKY